MLQAQSRFWKAGARALLLLALSLAYATGSHAQQTQNVNLAAEAKILSYADLHGWSEDKQSETLEAFRRSCQRIQKLSPDAPLDRKNQHAALYGKAGDWQPACNAMLQIPRKDDLAARAFFEQWFAPVALYEKLGVKSLFTGYYEPELNGSLTRGGPYQTPLLAPPPGFVAARARGEMGPSRAAIEAGALDADKLAILWLDDPIDAFFLHVQGSGRVRLPDGKIERVGFAARNGLPYTSIGKVLIDRGALSREAVSMQSIRAWLSLNPDLARDVMHQNESYIFFTRLENMPAEYGPLGAEGVPLTSARSLAVDREYHPTGTLLWLDSHFPAAGGGGPLRRLMVAQDTGTAIRGIHRGDVFWGSGDEAARLAGHMNEPGRLTALLPRRLIETLQARNTR